MAQLSPIASPRVRFARFAFAVLPLALLLSGCALTGQNASSEPQLVIPDFDSAKEQYKFAGIYKSAMIPSTEKKRRNEQIMRLVQCYDRVVVNFPEDRTCTPLARLEIADCNFAMGKVVEARNQYETILQEYPENDYVQARGLFAIAITLDVEGRLEESKQIYQQIHDEFGSNKTAAIRDIVKKADALYYKVRESKQSKKSARSGSRRG